MPASFCRARAVWALALGLAIPIAALQSLQSFVLSSRAWRRAGAQPEFEPRLPDFFVQGSIEWGIVVALLPLVVASGRAWPLRGARLWRNAFRHLLAAVLFSAVFLLARAGSNWWLLHGDRPLDAFWHALKWSATRKGVSMATLYASILGISLAIDHFRSWRSEELRASELERRLTRARLEVSEARLQPHFLFNTLHAITTLIGRDVTSARRMTLQLRELLSSSLAEGHAAEVALRRELELTERYLAIQRTRFGDRLDVSVSVEPSCLDALVPAWILQPPVENAIRHGIMPLVEGGRLTIRAWRRGWRLVLEIEDDGVGLPAGTHDGFGLRNTRERLAAAFGDDHHLELRPPDDGGTRVRIEIPFRRAEASLADSSPAPTEITQ